MILGQDDEEDLFDDNEEKKNEIHDNTKVISFESQTNECIEDCHQYLYYCAVLMNEFKQLHIGEQFNNDDFNYAIVDYHLQAEKKSQVDYSYILFDDYIESLSFEELNEVLQYLYSKEKEEYPNIHIFIQIAREQLVNSKEKKEKEKPLTETIRLDINN